MVLISFFWNEGQWKLKEIKPTASVWSQTSWLQIWRTLIYVHDKTLSFLFGVSSYQRGLQSLMLKVLMNFKSLILMLVKHDFYTYIEKSSINKGTLAFCTAIHNIFSKQVLLYISHLVNDFMHAFLILLKIVTFTFTFFSRSGPIYIETYDFYNYCRLSFRVWM